MKYIQFIFSGIVLTTLLFSGCKKKDDDDNPVETLLTVEAGEAQAVAPGDTVYLTAVSNKAGGNYEWNLPTFSNNDVLGPVNGAETWFVPAVNGIYGISVEVKNGNEYATDYVEITVSGAKKLSGELAETELPDVITDNGEEPDYIVTDDITVIKNLNIHQGVTIAFMPDKGMKIVNGGTVDANSVKFTSNNPDAPTYWKGILVEASGSSFLGCTIEYGGSSSLTGGSGDEANMLVVENKYVEIIATNITHSKGRGVYLQQKASFRGKDGNSFSLTGNTFANNQQGPLYMNMEAVLSSYLYDNNFSGESTDKRYVEIYGSDVPFIPGGNVSWFGLKDDARYLISGDINIMTPIVLNNGNHALQVKVADGVGIYFNDQLVNNADASRHTSFSGVNEVPGKWKGIYCGGNVLMEYLDISHAGSAALDGADEKAALFVKGHLLKMKNCNIENNSGIGLYVDRSASIGNVADFSDNVMQNNQLAAMRIPCPFVNHLVDASSTVKASSASKAAVELTNGKSLSSFELTNNTIRNLGTNQNYHVLEDLMLQQGKALNIESGVTLKFAQNKSFTIDGELTAQGTLASQIRMIALDGAWTGILINNSIKNQTLEQVVIEDAGSQAFTGLAQAGNLCVNKLMGTLSVTNCFITGSGGYGVVIAAGSNNYNINDVSSMNVLGGTLGGYIEL